MSDNVLTSSKDDSLEAKELPLIVLDGSNQPYCQLIKSVDENGHKNVKAYLQNYNVKTETNYRKLLCLYDLKKYGNLNMETILQEI